MQTKDDKDEKTGEKKTKDGDRNDEGLVYNADLNAWVTAAQYRNWQKLRAEARRIKEESDNKNNQNNYLATSVNDATNGGGDWFDQIPSGKTSFMGTTTETTKIKLNDSQAKAVLKARQDGFGKAGLILTLDGAATDVAIGGIAIAVKLSSRIAYPLAVLNTGIFVMGNVMAYDYGNQYGSALEKYNASPNSNGLYIVDQTCTVHMQGGVVSSGTTTIYYPNGDVFGTIRY